ncbi:MAG: hypothetical protein K8F59_07305 [Rhodobacteraceae bacterium]|nr:hypothetical protein [Paracoccaceae bacterium]
MATSIPACPFAVKFYTRAFDAQAGGISLAISPALGFGPGGSQTDRRTA